MVRDYWIYQERQSDTTQWAIYVVKEFSPGKPECTCLDFTIYSEDIENATNSQSYIGWHYASVSGYVDALVCELSNFTGVHNEDKRQLEREITRILQY